VRKLSYSTYHSNLLSLLSVPEDYQYTLPKPDQFSKNSFFPQLNSKTYQYSTHSHYEEPKEFLPFFTHIDQTDGLFLLATNNYTTCTLDGLLIGAENFDTVVNKDIEKVAIQIPAKVNISELKVIEKDMVRILFSCHRRNLTKNSFLVFSSKIKFRA
jgi:hypothetical protein